MLKKKPNELSKSWKQTATNLGHAKYRKKVVRKMGRLGKVCVPVGEACSTMEEPFVETNCNKSGPCKV
jgi:hypothetical protein